MLWHGIPQRIADFQLARLAVVKLQQRLRLGLAAFSLLEAVEILPRRSEFNVTLLDMIETALDLELTNKGQMFVLYDDCGKLGRAAC